MSENSPLLDWGRTSYAKALRQSVIMTAGIKSRPKFDADPEELRQFMHRSGRWLEHEVFYQLIRSIKIRRNLHEISPGIHPKTRRTLVEDRLLNWSDFEIAPIIREAYRVLRHEKPEPLRDIHQRQMSRGIVVDQVPRAWLPEDQW